MNFKDVFNPLKKCIGDGKTRQYFFRDLMAMITTVSEEEWGTELDPSTKKIKDNTIFNYIKRGLSQTFAQSIVNRLTPEILTERIEDCSYETRKALAGELNVYEDGINADNVGIKAADMMVRIITKSAGLLSEEELEIKKKTLESPRQYMENLKIVDCIKYNTYEMNEADELSARSFLINHEKEKELIPLCQIALLHSPTHKHIRDMYTEFILLPKKIQMYILNACDVERMGNMVSLHLSEAVDIFCEDLVKYELSSRDKLYLFTQYLYRAFYYYSNCEIGNYDNYSFATICEPTLRAFRNMDSSSLNKYIDDYLWMKQNKMDTDALAPLNYLWREKDFGSCREEELTYWLCRFVIDACNNLIYLVKDSEFEHIFVDDQYAETQEDLYYCALNALYNLYLCHTAKKQE